MKSEEEYKSTLDVPGSYEIIAELVKEYEAALDSGCTPCYLLTRGKLDRWLYPLARWYLDHAERKQ